MRGKISVFLAIFIISVIVYYGSYVSNAQGATSTLEKLVYVLNKEDVLVSEWSLYTREELSAITDQSSFQSKINLLKNQVRGFDWEVKREKDVWKAIGVKKQKAVNEVIMLTHTVDEKESGGYISYQVTGQGLQEKETNYVEKVFQDNYEQLFLTKPLIFSCVKGKVNDKMESVLSVQIQDLLRAFNAQPIESLVEESFTSVSAYTEMWEEALSTQQQEMNLQIALRKTGMGGQTTLVVGTPIITSEY
ncbi:hypothetical protein FZC66_13605 [Priestia megaterium]|nr:hypothetical protein FZC66_13605 [Priestia megaterium]